MKTILAALIITGLAACDSAPPAYNDGFTGDRALLGMWEEPGSEGGSDDLFFFSYDAATSTAFISVIERLQPSCFTILTSPLSNLTLTSFRFQVYDEPDTFNYTINGDQITFRDPSSTGNGFTWNRDDRTLESLTRCPS